MLAICESLELRLKPQSNTPLGGIEQERSFLVSQTYYRHCLMGTLAFDAPQVILIMELRSDSVDPRDRYWRAPATILWGILIAFLFIVVQLVVVIGVGVPGFRELSDEALDQAVLAASESGQVVAIGTLASLVLCGLAILAVIKLKKGASISRYLGLESVPLATLGKWVAALVACLVVYDLLAVFLGRPVVPPFMTRVYASASPVWLLWVALVIGAPVLEEGFFRGFLLRPFLANRMSAAVAVLVVAALWAAIHVQYGLFEIVSIFILGLLLGAARVVTGSTVLPIMLHALTNLAATVEAAWLGAGPAA